MPLAPAPFRLRLPDILRGVARRLPYPPQKSSRKGRGEIEGRASPLEKGPLPPPKPPPPPDFWPYRTSSGFRKVKGGARNRIFSSCFGKMKGRGASERSGRTFLRANQF